MGTTYYRKIKEIGFYEPVDGVLGLKIVPLKPLSGDPDQEPEPLLFGLPMKQARELLEVLQAAVEAQEEPKH